MFVAVLLVLYAIYFSSSFYSILSTHFPLGAYTTLSPHYTTLTPSTLLMSTEISLAPGLKAPLIILQIQQAFTVQHRYKPQCKYDNNVSDTVPATERCAASIEPTYNAPFTALLNKQLYTTTPTRKNYRLYT